MNEFKNNENLEITGLKRLGVIEKQISTLEYRLSYLTRKLNLEKKDSEDQFMFIRESIMINAEIARLTHERDIIYRSLIPSEIIDEILVTPPNEQNIDPNNIPEDIFINDPATQNQDLGGLSDSPENIREPEPTHTNPDEPQTPRHIIDEDRTIPTPNYPITPVSVDGGKKPSIPNNGTTEQPLTPIGRNNPPVGAIPTNSGPIRPLPPLEPNTPSLTNIEDEVKKREKLDEAKKRIFAIIEKFKRNWKKIGLVAALGIGLLTITISGSSERQVYQNPNNLHPGLTTGISEDRIPSLDWPSNPVALADQENQQSTYLDEGSKNNLDNIKRITPDMGINNSLENVDRNSSLSQQEIQSLLNSERWAPQEVIDFLGFRVGSEYVNLNGKQFLAIVPKQELTPEQLNVFKSLDPSFIVTYQNGEYSVGKSFFYEKIPAYILTTGEKPIRELNYTINDPNSGVTKIAGKVIPNGKK